MVFKECPITQEHLFTDKIKKYRLPPFGDSRIIDFCPTVHMALKQETDEYREL